jgi:hypothetical protein
VPIIGDVNGDGLIDKGDLQVLVNAYGLSAGESPPGADLDADGVIGLGDLNILAAHIRS